LSLLGTFQLTGLQIMSPVKTITGWVAGRLFPNARPGKPKRLKNKD